MKAAMACWRTLTGGYETSSAKDALDISLRVASKHGNVEKEHVSLIADPNMLMI